MLANSGVGSNSQKKNKFGLGPTLGSVKNLFSTKYLAKPIGLQGYEKKKKSRRSTADNKMEYKKRPSYADTAYREAVSRLKYFLTESYFPSKRNYGREIDSAGEETDNQSLLSAESRNTSKYFTLPHNRYSPVVMKPHFYTAPRSMLNADSSKNVLTDFKNINYDNKVPPEILKFINKQEEYIYHLEKETRYCKDELAELVRKVKRSIPENNNYIEKYTTYDTKFTFSNPDETETEIENEPSKRLASKTFTSPKKTVILEGPSIVFESRISELEAQLMQAKIELQKAIEENETLKYKNSTGDVVGSDNETLKKQLESLQREKIILQESVTKLQLALSHLKDKEFDTTDQMKRSLNAAEHAHYEKNAAEQEIRRLRDELDRQHSKLRETISEQTRRIAEERNTIERRYSQQIEQLTAELAVQWENANKVQLELDKQRRESADLRREIAQKNGYIDDLRKDMHSKIATSVPASLQSDLAISGAEKGSLEEQLATLQLTNERNERQFKQEINRMQAEVQSLRQRLDRADADLIHSRRENLRLNEQIASLEKEVNLNAALADEKQKGEMLALPLPIIKSEGNNNDVASMIKEMEDKHAVTVAELESMIHSQNQLMEKLTNECHALTKKLEDNSTRHVKEIRQLQTSLDFLTRSLCQNEFKKDKAYDPESTSTKTPLAIVHSTQNSTDENENEPENNKTSATINCSNAKQTPTELSQSDYADSNFNQHNAKDIKEISNAIQYSQNAENLDPDECNDQQHNVDNSFEHTDIKNLENEQYSTSSEQQPYLNANPQQSDISYDSINTNTPIPNGNLQIQKNLNPQLGMNEQYNSSQGYIDDSKMQQQYEHPSQQYSQISDHQQYSESDQQQYADQMNQQYSNDLKEPYLEGSQEAYQNLNQQYDDQMNQQYANDLKDQYLQENIHEQYPEDQDLHQQYGTNLNQEYTDDSSKYYQDENAHGEDSTAYEFNHTYDQQIAPENAGYEKE